PMLGDGEDVGVVLDQDGGVEMLVQRSKRVVLPSKKRRVEDRAGRLIDHAGDRDTDSGEPALVLLSKLGDSTDQETMERLRRDSRIERGPKAPLDGEVQVGTAKVDFALADLDADSHCRLRV